MVTNSSGNSVVADVFLAFGGKEHKLDPLAFAPNETKQLSVADMLTSLNTDVSQAPEGRITIIQQGAHPSLVAQGSVEDPVTGFSTTLEFPDPARQHANALHASGIPVGAPTPDSPFAGDGTFTPHVVASNLSNNPQTVTITLEYPKAASWNSTNGPGGPAAPQVRFVGTLKKGQKDPNEALDHPPNPDASVLSGQYSLAPLTVPGDSTVDFSLAAVINQLPLPLPYASVRIQYSGAPGSLIAQVSSVDERQDLVVDARTANEGDGWAGSGVNPWHVDSQTRSILFLTDESGKPARIGFRVTAGGVTYWLTHLKLNPHETRAIDLGRLRDDQAPDFKGNKIPAGATDGSVAWIRLDSVAVEGRLVVIKKQQGMASSYDCSACSCPAGFQGLSVAPGTFGILPLAYQDMGSTGRYQSCNGSSTYYYDLTHASSWNSNNTPVIAMDSSVHYRADGVSPGTANVTGSYTGCSMYDTNPDFDCPCINSRQGSGSSTGTVVWVTLSLKTSGTLASDDFAASTMTNLLGTNNLHTLMDTNGYWVTPVEVVGYVAPSTYTGNIIIRRQLLGVYVYDNCTLILSQGSGDDTSQYPLYDWDPQSGGSAGKVYDTDEPGILPQSSNTVNHVYHYRANFYEYAQTTINGVVKTVSSNLNWFARVSYLKTSSGSQLSTTISGDNIAGTGTTKTSCNLQ